MRLQKEKEKEDCKDNCKNPKYNKKQLKDLVVNIDKAFAVYYCELINNRLYGYDVRSFDRYKYMGWYAESLKGHYRRISLGIEVCLNDCELNSIVEKVKPFISSFPCRECKMLDYEMNESNKDEWEFNNPLCVYREKWETLFNRKCIELGFSSKVENEVASEITFILNVNDMMGAVCNNINISADLVSYNKENCLEIASAVLEERECKVSHVGETRSVSKEQCLIDFNTLKSVYECDISLETFVFLRVCDIDMDTITNIYSCGMTIDDKMNIVCSTGSMEINSDLLSSLCYI